MYEKSNYSKTYKFLNENKKILLKNKRSYSNSFSSNNSSAFNIGSV